jgi:hypothetical protein
VQDARSESESFGVVRSVEDLALDLRMLIRVRRSIQQLRTLIRSSIRFRGTAMMCAAVDCW